MIYQQLTNVDTTKAIQDTLAGVTNSNALQEVHISFANLTSSEIIVTILGYTIVFAALLILFLFISNFSKVLQITLQKSQKKKKEEINQKERNIITGEIAAVISTALYLHFEEAHDIENTIITIKKIQRSYSPWNSKLLGLRQQPKH